MIQVYRWLEALWISNDTTTHFLNYSTAGFYLCFYLCSFLFATNFDSVRKIAFYALHELSGHGHGQF